MPLQWAQRPPQTVLRSSGPVPVPDLVWTRGLGRCRQGKMGHAGLGWPNPVTGDFLRPLGHDTETQGRPPCGDRRTGVMEQGKEHPGWLADTGRTWGGRGWAGSASEPLETDPPPPHSRLLVSRLRADSCCFRPQFLVFVAAATEASTTAGYSHSPLPAPAHTLPHKVPSAPPKAEYCGHPCCADKEIKAQQGHMTSQGPARAHGRT